jgi:hypothetical protein
MIMRKILQLLMVFAFMGGSLAYAQQTYFDTVSIGYGTQAELNYAGSSIEWSVADGDPFPFTQDWLFIPDVNDPATTDNVTLDLSLQVDANKYDPATGEFIDSAMYAYIFQSHRLVFSGDDDPITVEDPIGNGDRRQFNDDEVFTFVFKTLSTAPPNELYPDVQTGLSGIAGWTNKSTTTAYPKVTLNGEPVGYLQTNMDLIGGATEYPIISDLITETPVKIVITEGDTIQLWGSDDTYFRLNALVLILEATIPPTDLILSAEGGDAEITVINGSLRVLSEIVPENSSLNRVEWSLENNDIGASINPGGILQAWPRDAGNGTVTVKGTIGDVSSTLEVTISGQEDVLVDSIYLYPGGSGNVDSITVNGGVRRVWAEVYPDLAANMDVVWTVEDNGTGAIIDSVGYEDGLNFCLLRANASDNGNGNVIVKATAADASGVFDTIPIFIINQETLYVESIVITFDGEFAEIIENGGTLQLYASALPELATDKSVTWSIDGDDLGATIDENGLLTASGTNDGNGLVTVVATANDGSGVTASLSVTIANQSNVSVPQTELQDAVNVYPNPVNGNQTLILEISDNVAFIEAIRIFDITGRNVADIQEFSGNAYRTELSFAKEKGIYLIKVDTDKGSIIRRAIVQ